MRQCNAIGNEFTWWNLLNLAIDMTIRFFICGMKTEGMRIASANVCFRKWIIEALLANSPSPIHTNFKHIEIASDSVNRFYLAYTEKKYERIAGTVEKKF